MALLSWPKCYRAMGEQLKAINLDGGPVLRAKFSFTLSTDLLNTCMCKVKLTYTNLQGFSRQEMNQDGLPLSASM